MPLDSQMGYTYVSMRTTPATFLTFGGSSDTFILNHYLARDSLAPTSHVWPFFVSTPIPLSLDLSDSMTAASKHSEYN
jgi:hypothetical protein